MEETKLTVRALKACLEDAKHYARQQDTTVSHLVRLYWHHHPSQGGLMRDVPITHRLSGILSQDIRSDPAVFDDTQTAFPIPESRYLIVSIVNIAFTDSSFCLLASPTQGGFARRLSASRAGLSGSAGG